MILVHVLEFCFNKSMKYKYKTVTQLPSSVDDGIFDTD